ncbi:RES domain-containing protein [Wenzhouxiangella sp. EGI_FJ10305]|uniref:RES domain-containing protein n=1 Tax=Wenzhouxiangella sp. EGI_FJ10305 TaxID=3243768 RepID=UPI0035DAAED5
MPLHHPPQKAGSLAGLPRHALSGTVLHRVWRHVLPDGTRRSRPWWFASADLDASEGGRFDLPEPMGTCYFGTRPEAALLEALQMRLTNLPREELTVRSLAQVNVPAAAPVAAMLTSRHVAGQFGITAELWAGRDRALSRAWAQAMRRDGWWALYSGVCHDPSGQLRAVGLFDHAGAHPPSHAGRWRWSGKRLDHNRKLEARLGRYGVKVREPGQLPWSRPEGFD